MLNRMNVHMTWIGLLCLLLNSTVLMASDIQPFSTDGCSAFPDGTPTQKTLWQECCIAHDLAYWAGGSYEDRKAVDDAFAQCISSTGKPSISHFMFAGVRAGGSPFLPTTYRWGYGWPFFRGYAPLTEHEKQVIIDSIDQAPASAFIPELSWWLIDPSAWKKHN